ncbi:MAG: hypothetical protein ABEJ08_03385 [Halobacteriaceae archaeon]
MASEDPDPLDQDDDDESVDSGRALSVDELDITEDEKVREIDDNRFVVSPDDSFDGDDQETPDDDAVSTRERPQSAPPAETGEESRRSGQPELDRMTVHRWLQADLAEADETYAFDLTIAFGGATGGQRVCSDDVVSVFESLLLWTAGQIDPGTPAAEVIGILLAESDVPVRYPPATLHRLVADHDLDAEDEIGDLLAAVEQDGLVFPPRRDR